MPVQECEDQGKPGFKWGEAGKCFTYEPDNEAQRNEAKRKAFIQGAAIGEEEVVVPPGGTVSLLESEESTAVLEQTKTEDGEQFPAAAYAFVPDPEKPSGWKLRLWESVAKKETPSQVGAAVAAFSPGGFRGQQVEIPESEVAAVKARVRTAWRKVNPNKDPEDMPRHIREEMETLDDTGVTETLQEFVDNRGVSLEVESGIIRGVKILGLESKNGRTYLKEAVVRAQSLYEGAKVNVNHPDGDPRQPRDYRDRIGHIANIRVEGSEPSTTGLFADFHFNPKHPVAEQLVWDANNQPQAVGFSHNIEARTVKRDGQVIIEEIRRVQSVDLVADPATTKGLFESNHHKEEEDTAMTDITLEGLKADHPEILEANGNAAVEAYKNSEEQKAAKELEATKLKTLTEENIQLKAEKATGEKQAEIAAILAESDYPEELRDDAFLEHIHELEPNQAKLFLVRLEGAIKHGVSKPKSKATNNPDGAGMTTDQFVRDIT